MDLLPFGAVTELSRWLFPQYSWCLCCRHGKQQQVQRHDPLFKGVLLVQHGWTNVHMH